MTENKKKATPLFIEDLGRVHGGGLEKPPYQGGPVTTIFGNEESPTTLDHEGATTNFFGEEGV